MATSPPTDRIALVAMLRHMQLTPSSFGPYAVAAAAGRAADMLERAAPEPAERVGDEDLGALYRHCQSNPEAYSILRRLVKNGLVPDVPGPLDDPAAGQWQPIETAPKRRPLLLGYWNALGNWRTVMGSYYGEYELESENDESGFAPAGWYEATQAYEYLACLDEEPTHWQPLPAGMPKRSPETKREGQ